MRIQRLSRSTHVNTLVDVCLMHIFSFLSPVPGVKFQKFGGILMIFGVKFQKFGGILLILGVKFYKFINSLQKLKNKHSSPCRLQMFGSPLLLQMSADVVRRLQTFYLWKNKQHLRSGWTKSAPRRHRTNLF
ncbi:hypothetical protein HanRHA438_Chr11g0528461 [Helianthus annuus]|nr:hypothetical protein HanRHA438_Chr11g0528461 [Helianthus annuus]